MFDFTVVPILTTDRLTLRELRADDAADVFAFRSDPQEQRFNSRPLHDLAESVALIQAVGEDYRCRRAVQWAVALRETGRVIGLFGFCAWDSAHLRAEIGYDLAARCWGQGLATEALTAVLAFGFNDMALNRVEAQTITDNVASVRLLGRLGFLREGVRRQYSFEEDGVFHDAAIYALLRCDQSSG